MTIKSNNAPDTVFAANENAEAREPETETPIWLEESLSEQGLEALISLLNSHYLEVNSALGARQGGGFKTLLLDYFGTREQLATWVLTDRRGPQPGTRGSLILKWKHDVLKIVENELLPFALKRFDVEEDHPLHPANLFVRTTTGEVRDSRKLPAPMDNLGSAVRSNEASPTGPQQEPIHRDEAEAPRPGVSQLATSPDVEFLGNSEESAKVEAETSQTHKRVGRPPDDATKEFYAMADRLGGPDAVKFPGMCKTLDAKKVKFPAMLSFSDAETWGAIRMRHFNELNEWVIEKRRGYKKMLQCRKITPR